MRIAVLGTGRGAVHGEWLADCPEFTVVSVAGRADLRAAAAVAGRHPGADAGTDPAAVLSRPGLEAVAVTCPPGDHEALVEEALRRDLLVMCEVPLAADRAGGLRLAELAHARQSRAHVAFQWRENPAVAQARSALLNGEIGELLTVTVDLRDDSHVGPSTRWPWRQRPDGGGALAELGGHAFDVLLWCTAMTTWEVESAWSHRVRDVRGGPDGPVDVGTDDVHQAELRPLGGIARARMMVSRICPERPGLDLTLTGSCGTIRVTAAADGSALLVLTTGARTVHKQTPVNAMNPYRRLADDLFTGTHTAPTFDDGLAAMNLVDAATRLAAAGTMSRTCR